MLNLISVSLLNAVAFGLIVGLRVQAMAELAQSREDYLDNDGDDDNEHEVGGGRDM